MPKGIKGYKTDKCSKCKQTIETISRRYCKKCHAEYMRNYRKTHCMNKEQKFKHNVRAKTRMMIRRGKIKKQSCQICNYLDAQVHHNDYSNPCDITWLCFKCHKNHHKEISLNETHKTRYSRA